MQKFSARTEIYLLNHRDDHLSGNGVTGAGTGFPYSKLISRTLYLQVFDYDRFSRDDPIGEVCLPLSEVDLSATQTMWKTLQPCKGHVVSRSVTQSHLADYS